MTGSTLTIKQLSLEVYFIKYICILYTIHAITVQHELFCSSVKVGLHYEIECNICDIPAVSRTWFESANFAAIYYTIFLFHCTQTADPKHFRGTPYTCT